MKKNKIILFRKIYFISSSRFKQIQTIKKNKLQRNTKDTCLPFNIFLFQKNLLSCFNVNFCLSHPVIRFIKASVKKNFFFSLQVYMLYISIIVLNSDGITKSRQSESLRSCIPENYLSILSLFRISSLVASCGSMAFAV